LASATDSVPFADNEDVSDTVPRDGVGEELCERAAVSALSEHERVSVFIAVLDRVRDNVTDWVRVKTSLSVDESVRLAFRVLDSCSL
jgi:hypothetical protein